jgi:hypothetical protein
MANAAKLNEVLESCRKLRKLGICENRSEGQILEARTMNELNVSTSPCGRGRKRVTHPH